MKFKSGITSHTIVKNEDRYIWFAINSILDVVEEMLIYDTGSTDRTVEIIKSINNPKIKFQNKGIADREKIVELRQEQIDITKTKWFLILDGDEIWWKNSFKNCLREIDRDSENTWGIVTPTINCIGDIYHYQEKKAGRYSFMDKLGHYAVRFMKRDISGLHVEGKYPLEGFYDGKGHMITDDSTKLKFVDSPYLHLTNLSRSTKEKEKILEREKKYEIGTPFPQGFQYPEVLSKNLPDMVPSPWIKMTTKERIIATIETPLKKIKRSII